MIRRCARVVRLAAAFLALVGPVATAQDAVRLEPHFENGRRTYVEQTARTLRKIHRDASTPPREARSIATYGLFATVTAADGDAASVRWTVERVSLSDETPGQAVRFDTDEPAAGALHGAGPEAAARALLGKSVDMRIARGQCDPNREQVAALRSTAASVAGDVSAAAMLLDEFSLERFRYSWGDARQALFAWRDVRAGETWENTLRQTAPDGAVTLYQYRCKLDSVEKRDARTIARVSFSGDIRSDGDEEARPNERGVTMKLDSGRFHGTAIFDIERREFTTQDTVAELRATATTPRDSAGNQQTIRLEQSIEGRTSIAPADSREKRAANRAAEKSAP